VCNNDHLTGLPIEYSYGQKRTAVEMDVFWVMTLNVLGGYKQFERK
jgi:hypothetical protein